MPKLNVGLINVPSVEEGEFFIFQLDFYGFIHQPERNPIDRLGRAITLISFLIIELKCSSVNEWMGETGDSGDETCSIEKDKNEIFYALYTITIILI